MTMDLPVTNGSASAKSESNSFAVKVGLARMLKGGVIMDVVNVQQVSICVEFWFSCSYYLSFLLSSWEI